MKLNSKSIKIAYVQDVFEFEFGLEKYNQIRINIYATNEKLRITNKKNSSTSIHYERTMMTMVTTCTIKI